MSTPSDPARQQHSHGNQLNGRGGIRVRGATLADRDGVAALVQQEDGGPLEEHLRGFEGELTSDRPDNLILVAEAEGRIVGFARARRFEHPPEPPENIAPEGWYLLGVTVSPAFRRRGVGTRLTQQRLEWIAERGGEVWFFTEVSNHASIALHHRFGFIEVSRDFTFPRRLSSEPGVLFRLSLNAAESPIAGE